MKCRQLLFGAVSLSVIVWVYAASIWETESDEKEVSRGYKEGFRDYHDKLLFNSTIIEGSSTAIVKVSKDVRFPPLSDKGDYQITCVKVANKGKGGHVTSTSGGMLEKFVNLHFESEDGKGFHFHILIYGYKYD